MKPLYKKFQTWLPSFHIYDSATNHILKVTKFFYDTVDVYFDSPDNVAFTERCRAKGYGRKEIEAFLKELKEIQSEGILKPGKPKVAVQLSRDMVEELLREGLQYLILVVTEDCNLRCHYCSYLDGTGGHRVHAPRSMSLDLAKRGIDYYVARSSRCVDLAKKYGLAQVPRDRVLGFYGGEPLLEIEKVTELIGYITSLDMRASAQITTNFTVVTPEIIDFLVENDVSVTVSLDGPRKIHDRNRITLDGKPTFDRVMNNLAMLRQRAPERYFLNKISFNVCLSHPIDYLVLDRFFREELGVESPGKIILLGLFPTRHYLARTPPELRKVSGGEEITSRMMSPQSTEIDAMNWALSCKEMVKFLDRAIYPQGWQHHETLHGGWCVPGSMRLTLYPNGLFFPCERVPDATDFFSVGDIDRGLNMDKIMTLMEKYFTVSKDRCGECWAFRLCKNCMSHAYDDEANDLTDTILEQKCAGVLSTLELDLQTFCMLRESNTVLFQKLMDATRADSC